MSNSIMLSVIITAHAEGTLTHRTIRSVQRAVKLLPAGIYYEIILHADNPTPATLAYIKTNESGILNGVKIYTNSFGDLGSSRNFAIGKAQGKYIATIDADDLMSGNWLCEALKNLELQNDEKTVAHSEVTVEFEGADSLILKHGEINKDTDTLLSVFANRWNSVIVAPRSLLLSEPYTVNSTGYGYEDWHLNCRLIARDVHNILIPKTAIFVRRKKNNSEWLRQAQSMAVLRANPLLSFNNIRNTSNVFANKTAHKTNAVMKPATARHYLGKVLKKHPLAHKAAIKIYATTKQRRVMVKNSSSPVPIWLQNEWKSMHEIDRQIFPTPYLMHNIPVYDTLTNDHKLAGSLYKEIIDNLAHDTYDYILFVPWLIRGGADKYAIDYANTIADSNTTKRVLVIATLPVESTWSDKLNSTVDFLDFGVMSQHVSTEIKNRVLGHIIENSGASIIHVLNSQLGYEFVELHEKYLNATNRKVVVTSFSQSTDKSGRLFGYSHTHVPLIYDIARFITSDNEAVIKMWIKDYGFDEKKLLVHRQPMIIPSVASKSAKRHSGELRILWAARVAPEKQPQLIPQIAQGLIGKARIHMYGEVEPGCEKLVQQDLPANLVYKGSFNGFSSLPLDQYDLLLYTSSFDGMPNTILEAASYNIPIVASAVGGIPEFIINGQTGVLVKDIDNPSIYIREILGLIKNRNQLEIYSSNALAKLKADFSQSHYKQEVISMLKLLEY